MERICVQHAFVGGESEDRGRYMGGVTDRAAESGSSPVRTKVVLTWVRFSPLSISPFIRALHTRMVRSRLILS